MTELEIDDAIRQVKAKRDEYAGIFSTLEDELAAAEQSLEEAEAELEALQDQRRELIGTARWYCCDSFTRLPAGPAYGSKDEAAARALGGQMVVGVWNK